jgi:nitroreductase
MSTLSTDTLLGALNWRYATKKFDSDRKIPADTWAALEEALILSPSSFGLQPWHFVVVQDPAVLAKLSAASWGQTQPVECSHYVVFTARKDVTAADVDHFIDRITEVRGTGPDYLKGYRDIMVGFADRNRSAGTLGEWSARQVYIALGQFMASAALLGVDACPMEGIEPAKYDEILGLGPKGLAAICACAAGYRAASDKYAGARKVRFKASEMVSHV